MWYGDSAGGQDPYSLSIQEGKIGFRVDDIATQWEVMTETAPSPGEWTFVATVLDTRTDGLMELKTYVNGVLAAERCVGETVPVHSARPHVALFHLRRGWRRPDANGPRRGTYL